MSVYKALIQLAYDNGEVEAFGVEESFTTDFEIMANALLRNKPEAYKATVYDERLVYSGVFYRNV